MPEPLRLLSADYSTITAEPPNVVFLDAQPLSRHEELDLPPYREFLEDATGIPITYINLPRGDQLPTDPQQLDGIFLGGSLYNLEDAKMYSWIGEEIEFLQSAKGVAVLGSCFGHQALAAAHGGGELIKLPQKVLGYRENIKTTEGMNQPLLNELSDRSAVAVSHSFFVSETPQGLPGVKVIEAARGRYKGKLLPNEILIYWDLEKAEPFGISSQSHYEFKGKAASAFAQDANRPPTINGLPIHHRGSLEIFQQRAERDGGKLIDIWVNKLVIPRYKAHSQAVAV